MSSLSIPDHDQDWEHDPHEPPYDAPRSWLERWRPRWSQSLLASSASQRSGNASADAACAPAAVESRLEDAVFAALRAPREPELVPQPTGFLGELDRRLALISIAGRFAAAIGIAAVVALFFVFLIPASRDYSGQADGAPSGTIQSMKATLDEAPLPSEGTKPALCELQNILGLPQSQPVMTHEQSETLLQQFMQWRKKPPVGNAR